MGKDMTMGVAPLMADMVVSEVGDVKATAKCPEDPNTEKDIVSKAKQGHPFKPN